LGNVDTEVTEKFYPREKDSRQSSLVGNLPLMPIRVYADTSVFGGEFFDDARLHEAIRNCGSGNAENLLQNITAALRQHTGEIPLSDDRCVLILNPAIRTCGI
jgi:hypothetical protein